MQDQHKCNAKAPDLQSAHLPKHVHSCTFFNSRQACSLFCLSCRVCFPCCFESFYKTALPSLKARTLNKMCCTTAARQLTVAVNLMIARQSGFQKEPEDLDKVKLCRYYSKGLLSHSPVLRCEVTGPGLLPLLLWDSSFHRRDCKEVGLIGTLFS